MSWMIEILKKYMSVDCPVAIFTNRNDYDRFAVGIIIAVTAEYILVKNINSRGEFDGYSVTNTSMIYRLESDSKYLRKIKKLYDCKKGDDVFNICLNGNLLMNILQYAIDNNVISKICIDEDANDIVGYIDQLKGEIVKINQISDYGEIDGETVFRIDEILKIAIADSDIIDLDLLFRFKEGK
ncbi:MAG TPA: hypothetical protein PKN87_10505 [Syntrophomonadaceae bacterium]|nr:hypothetical protein [Syntrophomonadaceae bacterium]HPR94485.1 hypothetical protein [Syntrophomonadaceae bacterium]